MDLDSKRLTKRRNLISDKNNELRDLEIKLVRKHVK